jgi:hypothetical protein
MVDSRGVVKKVSHLGHGGKAITEAKLINLCFFIEFRHIHLLSNVDIIIHACHIS